MARKSEFGEPNAFWKYGNKIHGDPWIAAIAAIDNDNESIPLIEMLLSDAPLDAANRLHLADFIKRKKFTNKKTPRTPSYTNTFAEDLWANAVKEVNKLMEEGDDERTALDKVSKSHDVDENNLADAKKGKLGSMRRAGKRKPKTP